MPVLTEIGLPTPANRGETFEVGGAETLCEATTVNTTVLLLVNPPTVTTTGPVIAPVGTVVEMLVALQFAAAAIVAGTVVPDGPVKVTVLLP